MLLVTSGDNSVEQKCLDVCTVTVKIVSRKEKFSIHGRDSDRPVRTQAISYSGHLLVVPTNKKLLAKKMFSSKENLSLLGNFFVIFFSCKIKLSLNLKFCIIILKNFFFTFTQIPITYNLSVGVRLY